MHGLPEQLSPENLSRTTQILLYGYDEVTQMEWANKLPYIQLPRNWKIQIIPPLGALIRYRMSTVELIENSPDNFVSVYFDPEEVLGIFGGPYWEIYAPNCKQDQEPDRAAYSDARAIQQAIAKRIKWMEEDAGI